MKRVGSIEPYETMRRAFRDLTDVAADGAATRARVLAGAGHAAARRTRLRRIAVPVAAALIASGSVSAALAVVHHWRAPGYAAIARDAAADIARRGRPGPVRIIPFELPPTTPSPRTITSSTGAEARAYARAHQAHFAEDAPARALDAWDAYLAAFPHGAFAPEAAYNRAICLVRLERRTDAARALRRIAAAPPGGYRREEALRLLDWLGAPRTD